MKIKIKKEIKQGKIQTSVTLKPETIEKLDIEYLKTGVSKSSIIDQIVKQCEFIGVDDEWKQ